MKLISVNVGLPRTVIWKGQTVTTGIFKESVADRVRLRSYNLDGDQQADLSVHGGASKAAYLYPAEHYSYWEKELPGTTLPWGMFGENLTTLGLLEDRVYIGDRLRIGSAEVIVTEPRIPCYKLAVKFGRDDIIKRFLWSGRSGFYLGVLQEGDVGEGDAIELLQRDPHQVTVADVVRLYVSEKNNRKLLQRVMQVEALSEGWRDYFRQQMVKLVE
ncbi:MAG: MOSC domain-containing protein [Anaerolineae bacterium]|nr:MOSC domain-containing protein [Anaerolineae bacterium]